MLGPRITGAFREIVIREFISYCEKAGSDIDNVVLSELGGSFCDTKHNISKDMTPNKDQKKKDKKKDDITPVNCSLLKVIIIILLMLSLVQAKLLLYYFRQ